MSQSQAATSGAASQKRVVFLHPDLGIGGAERLVVDAAVGLQSLGCKVTIFTSHCDPNHCFTEARDGTLDVRVRGNTIIPPSIGGRFAIFCAIARQLHLIFSIAIFTNELNALTPTHFFIDQLSAGVPLLRILSSNTKILFYCHFPDKLLAQQSVGLFRLVKAIYRIPFNWLESWSTSCGDDIVVNSKFTGGVVKAVFPKLRSRKLKVVYPCVDTTGHTKSKQRLWPSLRTMFLSINRFERKKGIDLAIRAYSKMRQGERDGSLLVLAGGYDPRLAENVKYLEELQQLADSLGLKHQTLQGQAKLPSLDTEVSVLFLPSIPDALKQSLLDTATLLIYTPRNEHFGIVPLEAMLNEVPVLAADEGGPVETVVDGATGWLRNVTKVDDWSEIMRLVINLQQSDQSRLVKMGEAGKSRVEDMFSKQEMAARLEDILERLQTAQRPAVFNPFVVTAVLITGFAVVMGLILTKALFFVIQKEAESTAYYKAQRGL
ncbi:glycosyltransferase family 4 protein [Myriangium duriaei CBS 260.36]|uniref:Alpha-1,3/1,6-mannosyltransferase ALG2 n=1 Tax=Myriangium duriaei CBS 260.36 TaxID=1168546 RepID=A0A9P4IUL1_9PEZI|nr:glycosyltransferase family 4 protein [Myriangium duriaei CBS 260.36]